MDGRDPPGMQAPGPEPASRRPDRPLADGLLAQVAGGDQQAYEQLYDQLAGPVYGLIYQIVRDPAQSEEVSQEAMLEVWRNAARFDPGKGSATAWVMTIAHRRAVDRVRSAAATTAREQRAADRAGPLADDVADSVAASLVRDRVRRCLDGLTELQRESITLAYYGGYSYRQVAGMLGVALSTIKTRIRSGLLRMRDCLGVDS
jgi:RNA polymerase sigma-70 factor, ECF subfamily